MPNNKQRIGWIGMGRMGFPMAERGGKIVGKPVDLADVDVLFSIVSTGKDLAEVYFGKDGVVSGNAGLPGIFVDCSTIAVRESAEIRKRLRSEEHTSELQSHVN